MIKSPHKILWFLMGTCSLVLGGSLWADDYSAQWIEREIPNSIGQSIKEVLSPQCLQIKKSDEVLYEIWLRKVIPFKASPESSDKALKEIRQTTLLGVIRIPETQRDYRDDDLHHGVHTLRFALKPQDGNHLGTSEFDYFAVLIPINKDPHLDGIQEYKALVEASSSDTASDHPMILSLRPPSSEAKETPAIVQPVSQHFCVLIQSQGQVSEKSSEKFAFEIVIKGMAEF